MMNVKPFAAPLAVLLALLILSSTSCRQAREAKTLSKCEFRMDAVKNTTLAGVNVQRIQSWTDLNFVETLALTFSVSREMPHQIHTISYQFSMVS